MTIQKRSGTYPYTAQAQMAARGAQTMSLLDRLKMIMAHISTTTLDDAIEYQTQAEALNASYQRKGVEAPEELVDAIRQFDRLIEDKKRDDALMNLRRLENEAAADLTQSERRAKRNEEIAKLKATLGQKEKAEPQPA